MKGSDDMGSATIALFVVSGLLAILALYGRVSKSNIEAKRKSYLRATLSTVPGFTTDSYIYSSDFARILAADASSKSICLIKARLVASDNSDRGGNITNRDFTGFTTVINAQDILSVEIEEDNDVMPLSMRPGAIGRAIAGGVIAGPSGAIVGATTGNSPGRAAKNAKRIDLKVTVSDIHNPLRIINLLNDPKADASYERDLAQQWQARIKALVHLAEIESGFPGRGAKE